MEKVFDVVVIIAILIISYNLIDIKIRVSAYKDAHSDMILILLEEHPECAEKVEKLKQLYEGLIGG